MSGAENSHVDRLFLRCTHRADGLFLNRAQQFDLHGQRQIGHLIEEQSATGSRLKQTLFIGNRAGETAFHVTEEFTFHQLAGNCATVYRDERMVGAGTLFVNQPRGNFFARTGLATDIDGCLAAGKLGDLFAQPLHRCGIAGQSRCGLDAGLGDGRDAQCRVDELAQLIEIDRLLHKIERTGLQGADSSVHIAERRDHRYGQVWNTLRNVIHQFQPIAIG